MNAYDLLQMVRDSVGEAVAAHWSDDLIMQRINLAQNSVARMVANHPGQWLTKVAEVTPVDGSITLPADCLRVLALETVATGQPISWIASSASRRLTRQLATGLSSGILTAYPLRASIEVNSSGFATPCYLWYELRVPNMAQGTASAGGAASLTMPNLRHIVRTDDYYNDVPIEIISGTGAGRDTISDYTGSTRACTVTGSYSTDSVFGTDSLLPDECRKLIELIAIESCLSKPGSVLDQQVFIYYENERKREEKLLVEFLSTRVPGQSHVEITEVS